MLLSGLSKECGSNLATTQGTSVCTVKSLDACTEDSIVAVTSKPVIQFEYIEFSVYTTKLLLEPKNVMKSGKVISFFKLSVYVMGLSQ